ncbi:unnamed protein product [Thelazia callipaeda]|uniref:Nitroreductase domain-containing protein n=1 Tax=Thelazia callipaeda TaxID=103827 RepID=A0A0N5D3E8_THECL|nr:unnamed protein product [Thelazia callipaeda]
MPGLLSQIIYRSHIRKILTVRVLRYLYKTTAPLQSKTETAKKASLVEKTTRKLDPFVAEHNEPSMKYKHHISIHGFELYPLQGQVIAWAIALSLIAYYASAKVEIVMDRSYDNTPFIWAAMKDRDHDYVAFGFEPPAVPRLDLMETLQEEMIEAARRRGTRK